ncbi:MAG TPA: hypothetical protein EYO31_03335 [Phycisphaerales bacterium]|nr:hypothetical protein [Phycisphaerales bacterium]
MGILDEGESAEVNSLLNFVNNPKKGNIHDWAKSTGMSVQKVLPGVREGDWESTTHWVEALKEAWDNEEPMIVIRNDGEDIQIHEIFGWNESNLGLTGSQKEVDYNWLSIEVSPERPTPFVIQDDAHEESFVFENFKEFLTTIGSTEIMEIKEDQGGGKWKTVEKPNYLSDNTGFLLVPSILIPQPYNLTLPKIMRDKMRKELTELRP